MILPVPPMAVVSDLPSSRRTTSDIWRCLSLEEARHLTPARSSALAHIDSAASSNRSFNSLPRSPTCLLRRVDQRADHADCLPRVEVCLIATTSGRPRWLRKATTTSQLYRGCGYAALRGLRRSSAVILADRSGKARRKGGKFDFGPFLVDKRARSQLPRAGRFEHQPRWRRAPRGPNDQGRRTDPRRS